MSTSSPSDATLRVDSSITLVPLAEHHAEDLFSLVEKNRTQLGEWLPWVDNMRSVQAFAAYIDRCKKQHEQGTDYSYMIIVDGKAAGRIGVHYIDNYNKLGAIGYWLGQTFSGRGIITKASRALIDFCFRQLNLNRIEIRCAAGNEKSAAVAERLNFTKEGILRQAELVNGQFFDLVLYSMLKSEWSIHPHT
jgi:ribosomal-protein-serine acetyltransferase